MKPKLTELSKLIRERRIELGMTQGQLAKKLGYTSQFIANWERGASRPPDKCLRDLRIILFWKDNSSIFEACMKDEENRLRSFLAEKVLAGRRR